MAGRAETARANGRKGGRPKGRKSTGTLEKEAAREFVRQRVTAELGPLLDSQIQHAKGLKYLVTRDKKTGKFVRVTEAMARRKLGTNEETIEVWEKDPSSHAFQELMNRALDKPQEPKQEIHLTGDWDKLAARLAAARKRGTE